MTIITLKEKAYWISELIRLIKGKQDEILSQNPHLLEDTLKQAAMEYIELCGSAQDVNDYVVLVNQIKQLETRKAELAYRISHNLGIRTYGFGTADIKQDDINDLDPVKRLHIEYLKAMVAGRKWLALEEEKKTVERKVMMSTSNPALMAFVNQFCTSLGITLN